MTTSPPDPTHLRDLLPAQAFQTLKGETLEQLNQELSRSPTLRAELAQLEQAVAALAYSAPLVPVPPELRNALLEQFLPPGDVSLALSDFWQQLMQESHPLPWQPYPGVPGIELILINADYTQRRVQCLIRAEGAIDFPRHRHAGQEEMIILDGDVVIETQVYGRGDRVLAAPNSEHALSTINGCLVFMDTSLDNEIL
ncbi:cupin domain-containing protein [filamentous cyanobacterium LEGE 11480]|uniref:Cupin domain-containing protein n=1 Tax=Romeriopsis navalis LEGE 11480 TaxID=2777977 RepID=A0A928VNH0_9CYAN|nr:cupin domain-containing protein [Romeriopsis navalis]MBE9031560.1 cupin domain-containing protein [Romeriopsis navalis LEGE 11480]